MGKKYSGKQVEKAGLALSNLDILRKDPAKLEHVIDVVSYWRYCHEAPLDSALVVLQEVVIKKDKAAIFAKRRKRYNSIVKKLHRFDKMSLKNMQDIGGCRAIVSNEKKLRQSVRDLKKLKFFRENNKKIRFKDYINEPKKDGYRGYHLIGRFQDENGNLRNIEVQLRTKIQHYWATALEIVDLFTGQALKSNEGEKEWKDFFSLISKQFGLMESIHLFEQLDHDKKIEKYYLKLRESKSHLVDCNNAKKSASKLKVTKKLAAFSGSLKVVDEQLDKELGSGYALLRINTKEMELRSTIFTEAQSGEAESAYTEAETEYAKSDIYVVALVSSSTVGGIKEAYPNYYADSSEFAKYLNLVIRVKT